MVCTESGPNYTTQNNRLTVNNKSFNVQPCKQFQGGGGVRYRDPEVAREVTSEGEGVLTWCLLQGKGGAAARRSEVRLLSILTSRGNTGVQATGRQVRRQARK